MDTRQEGSQKTNMTPFLRQAQISNPNQVTQISQRVTNACLCHVQQKSVMYSLFVSCTNACLCHVQ
jgi:hypothetical protein